LSAAFESSAMSETPSSPLDDMVFTSLTGAHAPLALRAEHAACYPPGFPLFAVLDGPQERALADLSSLLDPGELVALGRPLAEPPGPGWALLTEIQLVQMVCETPVEPPDGELSTLSVADVPDMLELVELTQPGPFGPRSIELGRYVGHRDERGALVALAGERLHPPGHTEVSAVCTHPDHQRKGLGEWAVREIASAIQKRGEIPFLHVEAQKQAHRLVPFYERLGFRERRRVSLGILQKAPHPG
jgi:predicted GNAT family acetyltransferase